MMNPIGSAKMKKAGFMQKAGTRTMNGKKATWMKNAIGFQKKNRKQRFKTRR